MLIILGRWALGVKPSRSLHQEIVTRGRRGVVMAEESRHPFTGTVLEERPQIQCGAPHSGVEMGGKSPLQKLWELGV